MTTKRRLDKIEKALPTDGSCPTCGQRRPDPVRDAAELADLRRRAEELIAAILPHYGGDRAAALEAVREQAPTLSRYLRVAA